MSVQQLDDSIYESEIALISSLINYPPYLNDCDDLLPEYFATESLQKIYLEIQKQSGKGYDPITIYQALSNDLTLEEINEISLADTGFFSDNFDKLGLVHVRGFQSWEVEKSYISAWWQC